MRILFAATATLVLIALSGYSNPALAADNTLTAEMNNFNYLLGGPWNCTTTLPAMMGRPAHNEEVTLTFDAAPGNVVHDRVLSSTYSDDDYYGYNSKAGAYWTTSADSLGNNGSATSTDGKTYTGTSSMGATSMGVTTTYTKVSPSNITMHEVISQGGQQQIIDSTCTR